MAKIKMKKKYGDGTKGVSVPPNKKKPSVEVMYKYVGNDRGVVDPANKIKSNGGMPSAQMQRKRKVNSSTQTVAKYGKGTKGVKMKKKGC